MDASSTFFFLAFGMTHPRIEIWSPWPLANIPPTWPIWNSEQIYIYHHHYVALVARISLTLSRHSSLSFIVRGQHPVSICVCVCKNIIFTKLHQNFISVSINKAKLGENERKTKHRKKSRSLWHGNYEDHCASIILCFTNKNITIVIQRIQTASTSVWTNLVGQFPTKIAVWLIAPPMSRSD